MNRSKLAELLEAVRDGAVGTDEALARLEKLPYEDLGFARLDHHRTLRRGMPEVVYAPGKTPAQIVTIVDSMAHAGTPVLVSRVAPDVAALITDRHAEAVHHADARLVSIGKVTVRSSGLVAVVSAGTADIPVAEEAALTAEFAGAPTRRLYDVGVAGLHRLLPDMDLLREAAVIVAVAGMEGALPSVVAGMVACPVIAVPTSVGYGTSFGGIAALLAMLNSCSGGVTVVNIDAGFNAGYAAALISRASGKHEQPE
jgi:hypothetical protein